MWELVLKIGIDQVSIFGWDAKSTLYSKLFVQGSCVTEEEQWGAAVSP
jgi:hypothetical protein